MLILDCETSGAIRNKGHPFDPRNKLCLVGCLTHMVHSLPGGKGLIFDIEYGTTPYGQKIKSTQAFINNLPFIVGVNLKFDLHWLRRYGIILPDGLKIWDCQIAHFLLTAQRDRYPSMDDMARRYSLAQKPSKIKEYWDNGVDTDKIPLDELTEYLEHDLNTTEQIYFNQLQEITDAGLLPLMNLCCADLLVLEEMEWNGMKYDKKKSLSYAAEHRASVGEIVSRLNESCGVAGINWESPQQISCILYGGTIKRKIKIQDGFFKTGFKAGQPRYRQGIEDINCVRLVEPLDGTKLADERYYSTDADTLIQLKGKAKGKAKQILEDLLEIAKLYQLIGTYYEGIPKKFEELGWEDDTIHHSLNQAVAVTGRLSCSNPNLQNQDKNVKECFLTRYEN